MAKDLPAFVDPTVLAEKGVVLQGYISLKKMTRLADSLLNTEGQVYVNWSFSLDDQERVLIQGSVQTKLPMQCQRCLEIMHLALDISVALMSLHPSQTEDNLLPNFEVLNIEHLPILLSALVEDELILALPLVAMHEHCSPIPYPSLKEESVDEKYNPFQILSTLKK